jgi:hypothetical protein
MTSEPISKTCRAGEHDSCLGTAGCGRPWVCTALHRCCSCHRGPPAGVKVTPCPPPIPGAGGPWRGGFDFQARRRGPVPPCGRRCDRRSDTADWVLRWTGTLAVVVDRAAAASARQPQVLPVAPVVCSVLPGLRQRIASAHGSSVPGSSGAVRLSAALGLPTQPRPWLPRPDRPPPGPDRNQQWKTWTSGRGTPTPSPEIKDHDRHSEAVERRAVDPG